MAEKYEIISDKELDELVELFKPAGTMLSDFEETEHIYSLPLSIEDKEELIDELYRN